MSTKQERTEIANRVIVAISGHGRKFFFHKGRISRFELATNGRLWFIDGYTLRRIYVMYRRGRWRGFSEGGTLKSIIENLADFIVSEKPIRNHFGPWPEWVCDGDLWGYGLAPMASLRDELRGILPDIQSATHTATGNYEKIGKAG